MTTPTCGADVVVDALDELGARQVFTLSGNQIMSIFNATCGRNMNLIHVRHEAAAVHMADGWGRLTGEPGIALVTAGPGFANCISALYVALMAESPLILLSGSAKRGRRGPAEFQAMEQSEMARTVTKASHTVETTAEITDAIHCAWQCARSGRPGPVHLSLPVDVLETPCDAQFQHSTTPTSQQSQEVSATQVHSLLNTLSSAQRPLILAGPAAGRNHSKHLLDQLSLQTGIPYLVSESPRGPRDPELGAFAWILKQADVVLLVGKKIDFSLMTGGHLVFAPDCRLIEVETDASHTADSTDEVAPHRNITTLKTADCDRFLQQLASAAPAEAQQERIWWNEVQAAVNFAPPEWDQWRSEPGQPLRSIDVCRAIQDHLDEAPSSMLIADGGEFGQWAQACIRADQRLINGPSGSIGSGISLALAGRLYDSEARIVAVMGDGTFGFHGFEFDTAIRYGLPFVAVVGNDARWNAEHQIQIRKYGAERTIGCELRATRYDQLVGSLGGHGEYVTCRDQLPAALDRATRSRQPACVNVEITGDPAPDLSHIDMRSLCDGS